MRAHLLEYLSIIKKIMALCQMLGVLLLVLFNQLRMNEKTKLRNRIFEQETGKLRNYITKPFNALHLALYCF